MGPVLLRSRV
jgi:hypothetical protein